MAGLGDILRGALGGEYSMGRDLDDEERRRIEELRAQGIHVPQERQSSPFRYGAGTVRKKNLADMRAAMQPDQKRRMSELMVQRGRGSRDALAMEQQQRRQQADDAIRQRTRQRAIADQGRIRELGGMPTMSPQQRFAADQARGTGPSMMYRSAEEYAADASPQITPQQQDELAVLQRENLPSRIQEQTYRTKELAHQVGLRNNEDQQRASQLAADVHAALPADYAQTLANKQVVSAELALLLDKHRLDTQTKYGGMIAEQSVNKQVRAIELELRGINSALFWLKNTKEGHDYEMQGGAAGASHRQKLELLQQQLLELKSRTAYHKSKTMPITPGDSDLESAIPRGLLTVPFVTP